MGTVQDHRRHAEQCVAKAEMSDNQRDKLLWLTLAQSWTRLAEHASGRGIAGESENASESDDRMKEPQSAN
jgi:putative IMPACT (imprinted ancient) family translation regulator